MYDIYSRMHKYIIPRSVYVSDKDLSTLDTMSYIFICIDNCKIKKTIIDYLIKKDKTFIDVGIGMNIVDDKLLGTLRVNVGKPTYLRTNLQTHTV